MPLSHELQSLCRVSLSCAARLLNISDCRTLDIELIQKSRILAVWCRKKTTATAVVKEISGAGDGNRTRVTSLEGWSSTIELHPQTNELNNSVKIKMVGMTGFEPATSCSQSRRATKLRHIPTATVSYYSNNLRVVK